MVGGRRGPSYLLTYLLTYLGDDGRVVVGGRRAPALVLEHHEWCPRRFVNNEWCPYLLTYLPTYL